MDEQLTQLVQEAQQGVKRGEVQHPVLNQLVNEILRLRSVGRALPGQPLTGVYQDIFERAYAQLSEVMIDALKHYNAARESVREWAIALQTQALKQVLDDAQLKQLALEAQRCPPHTAER